jgi:hypothetical protein
MDSHGAKARQAKSKARISAYEKMAAEQFQDKEEEFEMQIPPGKPLGRFGHRCQGHLEVV